MSYILDALKKAEQARQRAARVPTLATVHRAPATSAPRRPLWPWIIGGVVLLNAVALGWLLLPKPAGRPPASQSGAPQIAAPAPPAAPQTPAPSAAEAPPQQIAPVPQPSPASPPPSVPPSPSRAADQPRATAPVHSIAPEPVRPPEATVRAREATTAPSPVESKAARPNAVESRPVTTPVPPQPPTATRERTQSAEVSTPPQPIAPRPAAPTAQAPASTGMVAPTRRPGTTDRTTAGTAPGAARPAERPAASSAPAQDAPPDVLELIGRIRLQMVVYSAVPAQRLVYIDNQKYVEGSTVEGKLVVESITPDGAILTFGDKKFTLRQ